MFFMNLQALNLKFIPSPVLLFTTVIRDNWNDIAMMADISVWALNEPLWSFK